MNDEWKEAVSEATGKAIGQLMRGITELPPVEVIPFLTGVVVMSVSLLRDSGRQDTYVREMLEAAIASLDKPADFTMKDYRVN